MFAFEADPGVAGVLGRSLRSATAISFFALSLAGCASTQNYQSAHVGHPATRVAAAVTEVEDDGLPAQAPPPSSVRHQPDDPSEPWSPNYGGANPSVGAHIPREPSDYEPIHKPHAPTAPRGDDVADARGIRPSVPSDLPPAFRQKLVAAMTRDE